MPRGQRRAALVSRSRIHRIPARLVGQIPRELSPAFSRLDTRTGLAPERMLRALLRQLLDSIPNECWFVGLRIGDSAWAPTVFTMYRQPLNGEIAPAFFELVLAQVRPHGFLSMSTSRWTLVEDLDVSG